MAVGTKSIYEPAAPRDGVRVLITRYYPRGVKKDRFDRWVKALSPSPELLSSYREGRKDWDEFKMLFLAELEASAESAAALRTLHELSKAEDVTFLCYEKTGSPCHRFLVQEILTTPRLFARYAKHGRASETRSSDRAASTRIRFYPRRRVGRRLK